MRQPSLQRSIRQPPDWLAYRDPLDGGRPTRPVRHEQQPSWQHRSRVRWTRHRTPRVPRVRLVWARRRLRSRPHCGHVVRHGRSRRQPTTPDVRCSGRARSAPWGLGSFARKWSRRGRQMICWHSTRCCHGSRRNCALWILISIRCNHDLRVVKNIRKEEAKAMLEKSAVRILVLDDESFMLKLLSRILSNLG